MLSNNYYPWQQMRKNSGQWKKFCEEIWIFHQLPRIISPGEIHSSLAPMLCQVYLRFCSVSPKAPWRWSHTVTAAAIEVSSLQLDTQTKFTDCKMFLKPCRYNYCYCLSNATVSFSRSFANRASFCFLNPTL